MTTEAKLGTQAIGAAGELFIQYQLIKRGIDSARLTTDSGIDLALYVPGTRDAHTVQVKATNSHQPAGQGTAPQLWWQFPVACEAQWLAVVDLKRDLAWMLPIEDARALARNEESNGTTWLMWYLDHNPRSRVQGSESEFDKYRLSAVIDRLLGGVTPELP